MVQGLRTPAALAKDLSTGPSTHMAATAVTLQPVTPVSGNRFSLLASVDIKHIGGTQMYVYVNIHIHKIRVNLTPC